MGIIGVLPRNVTKMRDDRVAVASLNGDRCQDASVPTSELEHVTNNIATDESGGVYAVTDQRMLRYSADAGGSDVRIDWDHAHLQGGVVEP
ncbi:MAG TPA: hypothetical protein VFF40_05480 [Acidimicrobiia bacterium]|nr:hypothetical protein [Acidimicrobiia bacterium]